MEKLRKPGFRYLRLAVAALVLAATALPQYAKPPADLYPDNYKGGYFTGNVVESNPSTRQLKLAYTKGKKTATFAGILPGGFIAASKGRPQHAIEMSDFTPGMTISVFYTTEPTNLGGAAPAEVNKIFRFKAGPWDLMMPGPVHLTFMNFD